MKDNYVFEYLNENDFKIKERTIRKYNMLAYKKLVFDYYLKLKSGIFLGKVVEENQKGAPVRCLIYNQLGNWYGNL